LLASNKVTYQKMIDEAAENTINSRRHIDLINGRSHQQELGCGIIPSMIYYGLQILSPAIFYLQHWLSVPLYLLPMEVLNKCNCWYCLTGVGGASRI
jgi:hypothetical protein